jgi:hypothetical protein
LKGKPALFTVANSQQFFNAALTARSLQMVRPSLSSGVMEFNDIIKP